MNKKLTISVDFDDTIFFTNFPTIVRPIKKAVEYIRQWYNDGHCIIINTCRSGEAVEDAKAELKRWNVPYHYINENAEQRIMKFGGDTRKISADLYIDDKNVETLNWDKANKKVQQLSSGKKLIVCIVGESGSGKTTIADHIEDNFQIQMIDSYTTRPKRSPGETGHTFVSDEEFDTFKSKDMIAYTKFGDFRYCCLKKDVKELNIYVIDESGLDMLQERYSDVYNIISIRVKSTERERRRRGVDKVRINRDLGEFNKRLSAFDWIVRSKKDRGYVANQIDAIMEHLINEQ